jgi:hypothetical protein
MTVDEIIKRQVIQQWLSREARDRVAVDNNTQNSSFTLGEEEAN